MCMFEHGEGGLGNHIASAFSCDSGTSQGSAKGNPLILKSLENTPWFQYSLGLFALLFAARNLV